MLKHSKLLLECTQFSQLNVNDLLFEFNEVLHDYAAKSGQNEVTLEGSIAKIELNQFQTLLQSLKNESNPNRVLQRIYNFCVE